MDKNIIGYYCETGFYCPDCTIKLNKKTDSPIYNKHEFELNQYCDNCFKLIKGGYGE